MGEFFLVVMAIFEGDKFLFLCKSAGGKMGTQRERSRVCREGATLSFRSHAKGG